MMEMIMGNPVFALCIDWNNEIKVCKSSIIDEFSKVQNRKSLKIFEDLIFCETTQDTFVNELFALKANEKWQKEAK